MARKRTCKDVEYMVHATSGSLHLSRKVGRTGYLTVSGDAYFRSADDALAFATGRAIGGSPVKLSVLVHSERGARCYGGNDAVQRYREDPEASAFEQFTVQFDAALRLHVDSHGRVS